MWSRTCCSLKTFFFYQNEHLGVKRGGGLKNEWGWGVHRMSQGKERKGFGSLASGART